MACRSPHAIALVAQMRRRPPFPSAEALSIFDAGVKPELEVFDLGHMALAKHLYKEGFLADPPWKQLCLGVPWGARLPQKQRLP